MYAMGQSMYGREVGAQMGKSLASLCHCTFQQEINDDQRHSLVGEDLVVNHHLDQLSHLDPTSFKLEIARMHPDRIREERKGKGKGDGKQTWTPIGKR